MKRHIFTRIIVASVLLFVSSGAEAGTHTVDDDGGADFTTIGAAMSAASAGDTVYVFPGVYREAVTLSDEINLIGYGPHVTTIDGEGTAIHVVDYVGPGAAMLSGFRIVGSADSSAYGTWHYGGVHCAGGALTVRNCIIEDCKAGVSVEAGANPTIINNTIVGNKNGIILGADVPAWNPSVRVLVIHGADSDSAKKYQQILADAGILSDRIHVDQASQANYSDYGAIIVCTDTGNLGKWGTQQAVQAILNSQKPVLGMGRGGPSLFEQMGLSIRWGNCASRNDDRVFVVEPQDGVFNNPHEIEIPKTRIIDLYSVSEEVQAVYGPKLSEFAAPLGQVPDENYYSLVREGLHTLWGHTAAPGSMTEVGKDLFINVIRGMITVCYPDLPDPIIVSNGMEQAPLGGRRYRVRVVNWPSYPDDLFAVSPDLPPCDLNPNSSRTWVTSHSSDGSPGQMFCVFDSASDLTTIWFGVPAGAKPPPGIYVTLEDRRCGLTYTSNIVAPTVEPQYTHTIMNNIIVHNTRGIFYYHYLATGQILYNDVWGNSDKNYHDNHTASSFIPLPGTGEISADPLFVDTDDYRLGAGSPARDAGHPGPLYFDPDETRNDMGAYGGPEAGGTGYHPGSGFIFTTVGNLPTSEIEQNAAHPSHGLAVVDPCVASALEIPQYHDSPFGAMLRIHGSFGETDIANGVRYYQILLAPWDGPDDPPEPEDFAPMTSSLSKIQTIPQPDGTVVFELVNLGPKTVKNVDNVYELTYTGWWSLIDERIRWHTRGYANGKYTMTYRAFRDHPTLPTVLQDYTPFITGNDLDEITLLVDNSPVDVNIHQVKYDPNTSPHWSEPNDGEIPECGIINLQNDTENLRFNITANHPGGYMYRWILDAKYGKNKNAGVIAQATYPGVVPPDDWPGVVEREFESEDGSLIPWQRCAYQFRVRAWTRATNGYGYLDSRHYKYSDIFSDHYFVDFGPTCEWCGGADINKSGTVNWIDAALLFDKWLQSCGPTCE